MLAKFFDGFILAAKGIVLALRDLTFWLAFVISFVLFGTLISLLSGGFASFGLMASLGFPACLSVISDAFLVLIGVRWTSFLDWFVIFAVAFLQALLIAMIFTARKYKKLQKAKSTSEHLERASIAAGLAVLGTGCPTCGTALLAPILGAVFAGSTAIVGTISIALTIIAILIIILSLRKVGEECYCLIVSYHYKPKKKTEEHNEKVG